MEALYFQKAFFCPAMLLNQHSLIQLSNQPKPNQQARILLSELRLIFFAQIVQLNINITLEDNYNNYMNRELTRRRRDKGTQVNKRPAHTQGSKYGQKRVGLLHLLIHSDVQEGTFVTKQKLIKSIYDRHRKILQNTHPFLYECLKKIQQLEPALSNNECEPLSNYLEALLTSNNSFYQMEKMLWITAQYLSPKSVRFLFHKEQNRENRSVQSISLKQFPSKIQDFEIFRGSPPVAVINFIQRLVGLTISFVKQEQKQLFNYQIRSRVQKYIVQKDYIFVLVKTKSIIFAKMGDQLDYLDSDRSKYIQLKLCGSDVLVLTKNYVIKIVGANGVPKKVIRAGVSLSNVIPIHISTSMYVLIAEQGDKICLLTCYRAGKNNYIQALPQGLQKIEQTLYIGKWILLRTQSHKIYAFALTKDAPVKVFQLYQGNSPGMLKVLHRRLTQI